MFAHKKDVCPMCGVTGKELSPEKKTAEKAKNCPSCGTVFNDFGVILSNEEHEHNELELN